jgi:hypothetical protein
VAGEIFLLPLMAWFWTGVPAGLCGFIAWVRIRASDGRLYGKWIAGLGVLLATAVPVLGIAENIWSTVRESRVNRQQAEPATDQTLPAPREVRDVR